MGSATIGAWLYLLPNIQFIRIWIRCKDSLAGRLEPKKIMLGLGGPRQHKEGSLVQRVTCAVGNAAPNELIEMATVIGTVGHHRSSQDTGVVDIDIDN